MKPILLLGRNGQVAWELRRTLAPLGQVVALDRRSEPALDLSWPDGLADVVRTLKPGLIVNAAAYTAVDRAEQEPELAQRINTVAPGVLAEEAKRIGAGLVHFSTDYVFTGDADRPYHEDDTTGPQGVYGRTKLKGEEAIRACGGNYWILRTAWVYGGRGHNFLLTMLRLMGERSQLGIVDDQIGSPTWSRWIAEASAQMLARTRLNLQESAGIYHLTCDGQTSWYGFACKIRELAVEQGLLPNSAARIDAITSADFPTPAKRPAYSVLDHHRLEDYFGLRLPAWESGLAACLEGMALT
ncbi:dTDP-4-dehydrorhamnose reductase [Methylohalobius crimeensis]|uniref:dTDP-4-dehydrorhamnose reductase n=1 Tax=Methylohalobius crimeensis TaxID=244365 RepID=UPI0003B77A60|nr:dTDP-4-dehydrorhamnose reductase [Methylohalobius crimeensis]